MEERVLVSREQLQQVINEELRKHPVCAGVYVGHLQLPLQEPDANGCNWSQDVTFSKESNTIEAIPQACKQKAGEVFTSIASRYNLA